MGIGIVTDATAALARALDRAVDGEEPAAGYCGCGQDMESHGDGMVLLHHDKHVNRITAAALRAEGYAIVPISRTITADWTREMGRAPVPIEQAGYIAQAAEEGPSDPASGGEDSPPTSAAVAPCPVCGARPHSWIHASIPIAQAAEDEQDRAILEEAEKRYAGRDWHEIGTPLDQAAEAADVVGVRSDDDREAADIDSGAAEGATGPAAAGQKQSAADPFDRRPSPENASAAADPLDVEALLYAWMERTHGNEFGHDHHCPLTTDWQKGPWADPAGDPATCTCGWSAFRVAYDKRADAAAVAEKEEEGDD